MRRRALWITGGLAALGLCAAGWVWATWPASPPAADWSAEYDTTPRPPTVKFQQVESIPAGLTAVTGVWCELPGKAAIAEYDLTARKPDEIAPGTVVERTAPAGWSHLVIKSLPHVREDNKKGLPEITLNNASWMFTAFTADVRRVDDRYQFRAIGLGLGTKVNGKDTILTPETGKQFGADIGWIGGTILGKGYDVQRKAVLVLSGPSMGLLDTPVWFRCADGNRLVRYRYALLVDAPTGRLDALVWRLGEGGECADLERAVWLAPDTLDPAELVVDRAKVNRLGIPSDDAFAVERMPPGRAVPIPPDLRALAAQTRFTAAEAHALDTGLRTMIAP